MKGLLITVQAVFLSGVLLAEKQCDDTLPDGTVCGATDYVTVPDPDSCWKYFECDSGCVTHQTCQDDYKFDEAYSWCTFPYDVECGDRPCDDSTHCPAPTTTTTPKPDCTPEDQIIDCQEAGAGYFADEYNCRKYWHCNKGESKGEHKLCPDDAHGNPEMYDLAYNGCNFAEYTQCGGRPICDECNANCEGTSTIPPDCTPADQGIDCKELGPGWFPDEFNCRRYWHCLNENSEPEHLLCKNDEHGNPEMFDLNYMGCNYADYTQCGQRPVCDECNQNCGPPGTTPHPFDCGHNLDCSSRPNGWYADPYSCKKYWNCINGVGTHHICPDTLMYEPVKVQCDWPYSVTCGNRPPCNECDEGCP
eukprot:GFUD01030724.1.p1 GENE.GFUD01030724.1~~GFUD01030724.1.p1  ORF type:complete len:369 (-),score=85.95 GFUD01030724.1:162-1247(-)